MEKIIDGKVISAQIKDEIKLTMEQMKKEGKEVTLAVIQVGNDPASSVYVGNNTSTIKLDKVMENLNVDKEVLDNIVPDEQQLFRGDLILMASDGVSEVMDADGIELGNTDLYLDTIKQSACKSAQHFVDDIVDLVLDYNGDKKLRDDVTMLVAKVEG